VKFCSVVEFEEGTDLALGQSVEAVVLTHALCTDSIPEGKLERGMLVRVAVDVAANADGLLAVVTHMAGSRPTTKLTRLHE
jgi:hypothetical protein